MTPQQRRHYFAEALKISGMLEADIEASILLFERQLNGLFDSNKLMPGDNPELEARSLVEVLREDERYKPLWPEISARPDLEPEQQPPQPNACQRQSQTSRLTRGRSETIACTSKSAPRRRWHGVRGRLLGLGDACVGAGGRFNVFGIARDLRRRGVLKKSRMRPSPGV